jgi:hypothetical protein
MGYQVQHVTHVIQELYALDTKENAQGNPYEVQPQGMMLITPMFNTLYKIHNGIVFR